MIYVFLAPGFEETEAVVPIDMLRRCDKNVVTVGIGDNLITSVHGVTFVTDILDNEVVFNNDIEMIVLPGGMPGTLNLEKSSVVQKAIDYCIQNDIYIGAICAAPTILGHKRLLAGKKATCFEGCQNELYDAEFCNVPAIADGKIITGRSAGCALEFALKLIETLISKNKRDRLELTLLCNTNGK